MSRLPPCPACHKAGAEGLRTLYDREGRAILIQCRGCAGVWHSRAALGLMRREP